VPNNTEETYKGMAAYRAGDVICAFLPLLPRSIAETNSSGVRSNAIASKPTSTRERRTRIRKEET